MTTRFDRVRRYYSSFDEWARLDSLEGGVEFDGACRLLKSHLVPGSRILDLGGGPGRYSIEFAGWGLTVVLADISPELLAEARNRFREVGVEPQIESVDEVNATDLSLYSDNSFDAVVAFGPFYHLVSQDERMAAALEIKRILRPEAQAFIDFVPRIGGVIGLVERAAVSPEQVPAAILRECSETGVFRNETESGYQEGYYSYPHEMRELLDDAGLKVTDTYSLKSIAHRLAPEIAQLDESVRGELEKIARTHESDPAVVALSGHAVIVATA